MEIKKKERRCPICEGIFLSKHFVKHGKMWICTECKKDITMFKRQYR